MLSDNQVVRVRKAIESMYINKCTVTEKRAYTRPNGSTGFGEVETLSNEPCKIQYSSVTSSNPGDTVASISQEIRLFIRPDIEIYPGSKINIDSIAYAHSGIVAKYPTHQEIVLKNWEKWA